MPRPIKLVNRQGKFLSDEAGQIGVWFAILALPILLFTSLALDFTEAEKERTLLSAALDDAVLAAVADQSLTEEERLIQATEYFWNNFDKQETTSLEVIEASAERVELRATSLVPSSISAAVVIKNIPVTESSVGKITLGDTICLLTLDPKSANSFEVIGGGYFFTQTCSVQVNSNHKKAAVVNHGGRARAKDFCVTGGAEGIFLPHINTQCGAVEDPYKDVKVPKEILNRPCVEKDKLTAKLEGFRSKVAPGVELEPVTCEPKLPPFSGRVFNRYGDYYEAITVQR